VISFKLFYDTMMMTQNDGATFSKCHQFPSTSCMSSYCDRFSTLVLWRLKEETGQLFLLVFVNAHFRDFFSKFSKILTQLTYRVRVIKPGSHLLYNINRRRGPDCKAIDRRFVSQLYHLSGSLTSCLISDDCIIGQRRQAVGRSLCLLLLVILNC